MLVDRIRQLEQEVQENVEHGLHILENPILHSVLEDEVRAIDEERKYIPKIELALFRSLFRAFPSPFLSPSVLF